jgi:hypothetical protein
VFEHLLRDSDRTKAFYTVRNAEGRNPHAHDADELDRTIEKVQEANAKDEVFVVMSHDDSLLLLVDFFPKYANGFVEKGWKRDGRWAFLRISTARINGQNCQWFFFFFFFN